MSPLRLSILCGLLSAAFSFSSIPLTKFSLFSFVFFIFTYFWLVPILVVGLLHGHKYGLIAGGVMMGCHLPFVASQLAFLALCTQLLPALTFTSLISQNTSRNLPVGLGKVFSQICFIYLGILIVSLSFISDSDVLKETVTRFLKEMDLPKSEYLSQSFIQLFPGILSLSSVIALMMNIFVGFKVLGVIAPESKISLVKNDFKIPPYWDIIFLASLIPLLIQNEMFAFFGKNVLLLSCLPLYLYGLGIVYSWLDRLKNGKSWLALIIILSIFLAWPAMLVIIVGLLEPILKTQQNMNKGS